MYCVINALTIFHMYRCRNSSFFYVSNLYVHVEEITVYHVAD